MIRTVAARMAGSPGVETVVRLLERLSSADPDRLAVLTYHRVDDPRRRPDLYPGLVSATPEGFAAQVEHIAANYHVVGMDELLAVRAGSARLAPRSLLITFDDAYRDVVVNAVPVLERHGIPSILFVPTAYPDDPARSFWWDRLHAALTAATTPFGILADGTRVTAERADQLSPAFRRLADEVKRRPHASAMRLVDEVLAQLPAAAASPSVATWSELRSLPARGMALAPHSHTHPRLDRLDAEALDEELQRPRLVFRERLDQEAPPVLAYPDGAHDARVVAAAARAGYSVAFGTARGTNSVRGIDWLRLRRINIGQRSNLALIRAQLLATRRLGAGAARA